MSEYTVQDLAGDGEIISEGVRFLKTATPRDIAMLHLCQMAEDHSERMQPYEGDAGDETN